jgi:hypothetical protein
LSAAVVGLRDGIELLLAGRVPQHETYRLTVQPAAHKPERWRSKELPWEGKGKHMRKVHIVVFIFWCSGWEHPQGLHERWCSYCDVVVVTLWDYMRDGVRIVVFWLWHPQSLHDRWCSSCGVLVVTHSETTREMVFVLWCCGCDTLRDYTRDGVRIVMLGLWHTQGLHERWFSYCGVLVVTPSGPARQMVFLLWCCGWEDLQGLHERWCSYCGVLVVTPSGPAREMVFILWCSSCDNLRACTRDGVHSVVFWLGTPSGSAREMELTLWCWSRDTLKIWQNTRKRDASNGSSINVSIYCMLIEY